MMLRKKFAVLLAAVTSAAGLPGQAQIPEIGAKAPNFTLMTPEGAKLSLDGVRGKGTLVLVMLRGYPGYQCPYCVKQVHDFVENADKFASAKAGVLLVYPGPQAELDAKAKEFLAKQQGELPANVKLVVDPDYKMTNQYGLRWDAPRETAYPSTFLIDRNGVVFFEKVSRSHGDRTSAADLLTELEKRSAAK